MSMVGNTQWKFSSKSSCDASLEEEQLSLASEAGWAVRNVRHLKRLVNELRTQQTSQLSVSATKQTCKCLYGQTIRP